MSELQHSTTERGRDREIKLMNPRVAGMYRAKGCEPVCLKCGTNLEGKHYHRKRTTRQTNKIRCLECAERLNMIEKPDCFGARVNDPPGCGECPFLVDCSRATLNNAFPGVRVIGP